MKSLLPARDGLVVDIRKKSSPVSAAALHVVEVSATKQRLPRSAVSLSLSLSLGHKRVTAIIG